MCAGREVFTLSARHRNEERGGDSSEGGVNAGFEDGYPEDNAKEDIGAGDGDAFAVKQE